MSSIAYRSVLSSLQGFEPEYQAVLDRATVLGYTLPSSAQNISNNNKVKWLKAEGIWGGLSVLWFARQESGLADFATLNWVDPTQFQLNQSTGSLKPDFVANTGFRGGNGSGQKYFNTGWIPDLDSNIASNDIGCFYKSFDIPSTYVSTTYIAGTRNANDRGQISISDVSNTLSLFRIFTNVSSTTTQSLENGHFSFFNNGTSPYTIYKNGTSYLTVAISGPTALKSNVEVSFLGFNDNGTKVGTNTNGGVSYLSFGNATDLIGKQIEIYEIMEDLYTP